MAAEASQTEGQRGEANQWEGAEDQWGAEVIQPERRPSLHREIRREIRREGEREERFEAVDCHRTTGAEAHHWVSIRKMHGIMEGKRVRGGRREAHLGGARSMRVVEEAQSKTRELRAANSTKSPTWEANDGEELIDEPFSTSSEDSESEGGSSAITSWSLP